MLANFGDADWPVTLALPKALGFISASLLSLYFIILWQRRISASKAEEVRKFVADAPALIKAGLAKVW